MKIKLTGKYHMNGLYQFMNIIRELMNETMGSDVARRGWLWTMNGKVKMREVTGLKDDNFWTFSFGPKTSLTARQNCLNFAGLECH